MRFFPLLTLPLFLLCLTAPLPIKSGLMRPRRNSMRVIDKGRKANFILKIIIESSFKILYGFEIYVLSDIIKLVRNVVDKIHKTTSKRELLKRGFYSGVGWAFGATIGFAIISTILVFFLRSVGGIPLIGSWIATIVDATLQQLTQRTPIFPQ